MAPTFSSDYFPEPFSEPEEDCLDWSTVLIMPFLDELKKETFSKWFGDLPDISWIRYSICRFENLYNTSYDVHYTTFPYSFSFAYIGMAHQFEQLRDFPRRILCVVGLWQCILLLLETVALGGFAAAHMLELCVCLVNSSKRFDKV